MNPLYLMTLAYALGILLSSSLWPCWWIFVALIALGLWRYTYARQQPYGLMLAGLSLAVLLGVVWTPLRQPAPAVDDPSHFIGQSVVLSGRIQEMQWQEQQVKLTLLAEELSQNQQLHLLSGKIRLGLKQVPLGQLHVGDRIQVAGRLQAPSQAQNFERFSYRDYLARQGVFTQLYARDFKLLSQAQGSQTWLPRVRQFLLAGFDSHLAPAQARVLGSLILGEGVSPVPSEVKLNFQNLGLQHVLAVSGFQVQLVMLAILWVFQKCGCPRWFTAILAALSVWCFVALTGAPASVLRAAMVATLFLLGYACFRKLSALPALVLAALLILLWQPQYIFDLGFAFSCLATLGLIISAQVLQTRLSGLPLFLSGALGPLLAAQLWVLPLQFYFFGQFSWLFLPANLVAGLFTTLLTWLALAAALAGALSSFMQGLILIPAGWVASCFLSLGQLLVQLPQPLWSFRPIDLSFLVLAYLILALSFAKCMYRPQLILALLLSAPVLSAGLQFQRACPVKVTYLSVGQGDATLIQTPDQVILIDAGPRWKKANGEFDDAGKRAILPFLQQAGIKQIDLAILSHAHLDHYGGFFSIAEAVPIRQFVAAPDQGDSSQYQGLLKRLTQHGTQVIAPANGSLLALNSQTRLVFWQALHSDDEDIVSQASHDLNNRSLVIQLIHQEVRFLFAGDIEAEGEQALLAQPGFQPQATVLKVPHHGSKTSSGLAFMHAVQPREAIVSVGERNRFRHPAPAVIRRYQESGTRVWRTDQAGAVCVCSRGRSYEILSAIAS